MMRCPSHEPPAAYSLLFTTASTCKNAFYDVSPFSPHFSNAYILCQLPAAVMLAKSRFKCCFSGILIPTFSPRPREK